MLDDKEYVHFLTVILGLSILKVSKNLFQDNKSIVIDDAIHLNNLTLRDLGLAQ